MGRRGGGEAVALPLHFFDFREEGVQNMVHCVPFMKCMNPSASLIYIERIAVPNLH